MIDKRIR